MILLGKCVVIVIKRTVIAIYLRMVDCQNSRSWTSRAVPSRSCSSSTTFSRRRSTGLAWAHRGTRGPPRRPPTCRPTPPGPSPASSFTELFELPRNTRRKRKRGGERKRGGWQAGTTKKKLFDGPEEETQHTVFIRKSRYPYCRTTTLFLISIETKTIVRRCTSELCRHSSSRKTERKYNINRVTTMERRVAGWSLTRSHPTRDFAGKLSEHATSRLEGSGGRSAAGSRN